MTIAGRKIRLDSVPRHVFQFAIWGLVLCGALTGVLAAWARLDPGLRLEVGVGFDTRHISDNATLSFQRRGAKLMWRSIWGVPDVDADFDSLPTAQVSSTGVTYRVWSFPAWKRSELTGPAWMPGAMLTTAALLLFGVGRLWPRLRHKNRSVKLPATARAPSATIRAHLLQGIGKRLIYRAFLAVVALGFLCGACAACCAIRVVRPHISLCTAKRDDAPRIWSFGGVVIRDGRVSVFGIDFRNAREWTRAAASPTWLKPLFSLKVGGSAELVDIHADTSAWLMFLILAGAPLAIWVRRRWLTRDRRKPGHCTHCGYNLAGNTSARCPECGTAFDGTVERPTAAQS